MIVASLSQRPILWCFTSTFSPTVSSSSVLLFIFFVLFCFWNLVVSSLHCTFNFFLVEGAQLFNGEWHVSRLPPAHEELCCRVTIGSWCVSEACYSCLVALVGLFALDRQMFGIFLLSFLLNRWPAGCVETLTRVVCLLQKWSNSVLYCGPPSDLIVCGQPSRSNHVLS